MELHKLSGIHQESERLSAERFEIVDVPLGDETRMTLPDQTYTQELLNIPVSLENRLAHLLPYIEPIAGEYTQHTIANRIGANPGWVVRTAEHVGIVPVAVGDEEASSLRKYASPALELLQEEWDWYQAYHELDDYLSEIAIAHFVAKSPQWVRSNAHELEVYPVPGHLIAGRERLAYEKQLIPKLRHLLLVFAPAEDWCTKQELIDLSGKQWPWIDKRLSKAGIEIQMRRSELSGIVNEFIAPEARALLAEIKGSLPGSAGNSLTLEGISKKIGRSTNWIIPRMPADYKSLGKNKVNDTGQVRLHYSPEVWQHLEVLSRSEDDDRGLALAALAKRVGKSWAWIESRIPYTTFAAEESKDRASILFDDRIVNELHSLAEEENSDTRLSVSEIAQIIGHTSHWVRSRLAYTEIVPEAKRGKGYLVYQQEVIAQLRALPEDIIKPGPKTSRQNAV